jgi:hypothetical protein
MESYEDFRIIFVDLFLLKNIKKIFHARFNGIGQQV